MMIEKLILYPVFVQIGLTFFLLFFMGFARTRSITSGQIKISDIALGQQNWPEFAQKVSNCFHNQLETPLFLYLLVIFAMLTNQVDHILIWGSWFFIVTRFAHAYVQITSNYVPYRYFAFLAGIVCLLTMWIYLVVKIAMA